MKTFYFDLKDAIETHDKIIDMSGGRHGHNNVSLLESVLNHIQNDDYYPHFLDKIAHLCFQVNKSHAFQDGNKRTSIALGAYLLELNGYDYCVVDFNREMENIALWVAQGRIGKDLLRRLIEDVILLEQRFETQLALIESLEKSFDEE
ncbi:MAG: type II toxin-antitoxin system death-on-curing family toxin [Alphaproteobacteria bacterium]|nr:type II toxin-antitoxin system death-on-curing family toxin [Alphaproteobacteria bacterium]